MNLISTDLNIFYLSGSGGFYLLHYMMLFNSHWCRFHHSVEFNQRLIETWCNSSNGNADQLRLAEQTYQQCQGPDWPDYDVYCETWPDVTPTIRSELQNLHRHWAYNIGCLPGGFDLEFQSVLRDQWSMPSMASWKHNEHWPINDQTQTINTQARPHKIYFTCNDVTQWLEYPGQRVVIYTDCDSMLILNKAKLAGIYQPFKNFDVPALEKAVIENSIDYNNKKIAKSLLPAIAQADCVIYLQDLIRSPETSLNICVTEQHRAFTQHWLSLHSQDILSQIGLNV